MSQQLTVDKRLRYAPTKLPSATSFNPLEPAEQITGKLQNQQLQRNKKRVNLRSFSADLSAKY